MTQRKRVLKPRGIGCSSFNNKCDRVECVYCSHTNHGIYCGDKNKIVTPEEVKNCTSWKDKYN